MNPRFDAPRRRVALIIAQTILISVAMDFPAPEGGHQPGASSRKNNQK
ncbi:MAG: hypothetical protein ACLQVY_24825 [Limisphaerales bacterium]